MITKQTKYKIKIFRKKNNTSRSPQKLCWLTYPLLVKQSTNSLEVLWKPRYLLRWFSYPRLLREEEQERKRKIILFNIFVHLEYKKNKSSNISLVQHRDLRIGSWHLDQTDAAEKQTVHNFWDAIFVSMNIRICIPRDSLFNDSGYVSLSFTFMLLFL